MEQPAKSHYNDVIMGTIAPQITSLTIVYSTVYSGADQSKHQSSASLAFVCGIHRGPVNSPHKWPVTRKKLPFDDVIMTRMNNPRTTWVSCDKLCWINGLKTLYNAHNGSQWLAYLSGWRLLSESEEGMSLMNQSYLKQHTKKTACKSLTRLTRIKIPTEDESKH